MTVSQIFTRGKEGTDKEGSHDTQRFSFLSFFVAQRDHNESHPNLLSATAGNTTPHESERQGKRVYSRAPKLKGGRRQL